MSSGERPIGAAKGKQLDTEALCQTLPSLLQAHAVLPDSLVAAQDWGDNTGSCDSFNASLTSDTDSDFSACTSETHSQAMTRTPVAFASAQQSAVVADSLSLRYSSLPPLLCVCSLPCETKCHILGCGRRSAMLCSLKGVSAFVVYADDLWSTLNIGSYGYDQHI